MIESKHIEEILEQRRRCCVFSLDAYPDAAMRLDFAISAALAACDSSWRSMESAPRDGTPILMRFVDVWPDVGSWFAVGAEGWWTCHCLRVYPIGWTPLPAAPEVEDAR